jgi:archaellum component FlaF (FlaF/FlaG flagellin family)
MIIFFAENVVFVSVFTRAKRIENAKQFLKENLIEIIVCVVCIYDLIEITLYNSIKRQKDEITSREKHNKILSQDKTNVLHNLIKFKSMSDKLSTHNLLFEIIFFLKSKKESNLLIRR